MRRILVLLAVVFFVACEESGTIVEKQYIPGRVEVVEEAITTYDGAIWRNEEATFEYTYPELFIVRLRSDLDGVSYTFYVPEDQYNLIRVGEGAKIPRAFQTKPKRSRRRID